MELMDKHWANLLINAPARHYGHTIQSKAHRAPKRDEEKRDREMGHAFCGRGRVTLSIKI
jgi:hypothetical protein